jgi:Ser/Thr protein kinase RdoA (MazF antagonist)
MSAPADFYSLTPERVLEAVESAGLPCTGRCLALNSFENRVYDVELELDERPSHASAHRRVVKFYRPGRWSEAQIREEHRFLLDLEEAEVPAIQPLRFPGGDTLRQTPEGIWFTVFPKVGGRAPDEMTEPQLRSVGRLLARIHQVGAARAAPARLALTPGTYGLEPLDFLLKGEWIPIEFRARYEAAVRAICAKTLSWFQNETTQRVHGDCHLGNLLHNPDGYFFLDFDDMLTAPPVQDLWLLLPGRPFGDARSIEAQRMLEALLEGYEEMRRFDRAALRLIEPLRALRFIHYTAWIARRWEDPAFPPAFPQFGSHRYWSDQTDDLEEQLRQI